MEAQQIARLRLIIVESWRVARFEPPFELEMRAT